MFVFLYFFLVFVFSYHLWWIKMLENEKNHVASEWEELIVAMVTNWGGHYHQLTSVDTRVCSRWLASDVDDDDNERRQGQRRHWLSPAPAVCKWRFSAQLYADECRPRPAGRCSRARHQGAPSARQPTSLSSSFNSSRWIDRRSRDPIPSPSLRICPPPLPARGSRGSWERKTSAPVVHGDASMLLMT